MIVAKKQLFPLEIFALLLGLLIRVIVYFQNRNLFLDEAAVALNVCERPWHALFHSLDYHQHFPPFLLLLIQWFGNIFGMTDFTLRLIPVLAGLFALILFFTTARKTLKNAWFPILIFSCSIFLVRYQTELKQYSTDILASVIFLCLLYRLDFSKKLHILSLFAFCLFAPWFSMPSIFLITALIVYYLLSRKIPYSNLLLLTFLSGVSFLFLYWMTLRPSIGSSHLMAFHEAHIMRLSIHELMFNYRILEGFIGAWLGGTAYTIGSIFLLTALGIFRMRKDQRLLPIFMVFVLTIIASLLKQYSMIPRLLCFWSPLLLWIWGHGADQFFSFCSSKALHRYLSIFLFLVLFLFPNVFYRQALTYIWTNYQVEQPKELLSTVRESRQKEDQILVTQFASRAVKFYTQCQENPILDPAGIELFDHPYSDQTILRHLEENNQNRIWVFDCSSADLKQELFNRYPNSKVYETKACFAMMILKNPKEQNN